MNAPHSISAAQAKEAYQALEQAIRDGSLADLARALTMVPKLDLNARVYEKNRTAVQLAVIWRRPHILEFLVRAGASPNVTDLAGNSPLRYATSQRDERLMKLFLEHGADPDLQPDPVPGRKISSLLPIHEVCIQGWEKGLKLLLDYGADVHARAGQGGAPLWFAAANNRLACAARLISHGANPNQRFLNQTAHYHPTLQRYEGITVALGKSSLFSPGTYNFLEMIAMLLDAGADPLLKDQMGDTAETYAERYEANNGPRLAHQVYDRYKRMPMLTRAKLVNLTKEEIFRPNIHHRCLADHPSFWHAFPEVARALQRQGETLTKEELLRTNSDGKTWLQRAVECFATAPVLSYLNAQGSGITAQDLLQPDGSPSPLLETAVSRRQLRHMFSEDVWAGKSVQDVQKIWMALPSDAREDVGGLRALLVKLSREQASRGQGRT